MLSVLLVSMVSPNVFSQETVIRVAPRPLWFDDDPQIVDIVIENGQDVAGYQVMLQFDSGKLEYAGIQHGDYLPSGSFFGEPQIIDTNPNDSMKAVRFAATAITGESNGDGVLATLTFDTINNTVSDFILLDTATSLSNRAGELSSPHLEHSKTFLRTDIESLLTEFISLDDPFGAVASIAPRNDILDADDLSNIRANWEDIADRVESYEGNEKLDVNADGSVTERDLRLVEFALKLDITEDGILNSEDVEAMAEAVQAVAPIGRKYDIDGDGSVTKTDESIVYRAVQQIDSRTVRQIDWKLPQDLITDVAHGKDVTYFVLDPQILKGGDMDDNYYDNYYGATSITLHIPGTKSYDREKSLNQLVAELPKEFPYFMAPLELPAERLEAAKTAINDATYDVWRKVGKASYNGIWFGLKFFTGPVAILFKTVKAAVDEVLEVVDLIISVVEATIAVVNLKEEHRDIVDAFLQVFEPPEVRVYRDATEDTVTRILFRIPQRLESIKITGIRVYSSEIHYNILQTIIGKFENFEATTAHAQVEAGLLVSVPENEHEYYTSWPPYYYYENDQIRIEFYGFDGTHLSQKLEGIPDDHLMEHFGYSADQLEILRSYEPKFVTVLIPKGTFDSPVTFEAMVLWSRYGEIHAHLESIIGTMSGGPTAYGGELVEVKKEWNLELETGMEAPHAQPMSLIDYPPFQQLPPKVQAYILQHFEGYANHKAINPEAWQIPEETSLLPNYPNPFNPETWIPYQLAEPATVSLTIYDINGRVVRDLDLGHQRAGIYHSRARAAYWDGRNAHGEPVASGIYFYTLKAGDFAATRKMLIRK